VTKSDPAGGAGDGVAVGVFVGFGRVVEGGRVADGGRVDEGGRVVEGSEPVVEGSEPVAEGGRVVVGAEFDGRRVVDTVTELLLGPTSDEPYAST
jgi:hypothetical protein